MTPAITEAETPPVAARLPRLDRFLPVWIAAAMAGGLILGRLVPDLNATLERVKVNTVSLPIGGNRD